MRIVVFVLFALLFCTDLSAQNIAASTLSWKISYLHNVNTGEQLSSDNEQILTYGSERIEWQNADGGIKNTFLVNKVSGNWSNVSNNGYIIYQVTQDLKSGTVTFERSKNDIIIRILLVEGDGAPEMYEFKIAKISTL